MSFCLLNIKAMKTKKNKPLVAETAASADVGIASDALSRLAEKLKTDLAKPDQQSKQKSSRPLDTSGSKKSKSKQTERLQSNGTAEVGRKYKKSPSKISNGAANSGQSDEAKEHKKQNRHPKQHSQASRSPKSVSSLKPVTSKRDRTGEKSSGKEEPEKGSLLEEIIALGGTEEDLALVDGISSDDDVEKELSSVQKPKHKVDNDKSVCPRIPLLIISCRRNYGHNSNPWD